ncbi:MAG: ABC transporter permease [Coriobacteriia bacterium]|nr:ABC transporter permease [Coriobacteriia bacterium]
MFEVRYACTSAIRRFGPSAFFIGTVGVALALLVLMTGLMDAIVATTGAALEPLRTAGMDLVVTAGAPVEIAAARGEVRLDPSGLVPGERFTKDMFRVDAYWPLSDEVSSVLASDDVLSASPVLLLNCSRVSGTAPDTIVVPRLVVDPLTGVEKATIERRLARDATYRAVEAKLFALRARERAGESVSQSDKAALARELVELEFAYYPERFKGVPTETVGATPVNARSESFMVAGVGTDDDASLLRDEDIVSGKALKPGQGSGVVLEQSFAKGHGLSVGDAFLLSGVNQRVVGIAALRPGITSAQVFIPVDALRSLAHVTGYNMASVRTRGSAAAARVSDRIRAADQRARVTEVANMSASLGTEMAVAEGVMVGHTMLIKAALVAAVAVVILLASLNTYGGRGREIWTLSAVGWSRARIAATMMLEAAILIAAGTLVGSAVTGVVLSVLGTNALATPVSIGVLDQGIAGGDQVADVLVVLTPQISVGFAAAAAAVAAVAGLAGSAIGVAKRIAGQAAGASLSGTAREGASE